MHIYEGMRASQRNLSDLQSASHLSLAGPEGQSVSLGAASGDLEQVALILKQQQMINDLRTKFVPNPVFIYLLMSSGRIFGLCCPGILEMGKILAKSNVDLLIISFREISILRLLRRTEAQENTRFRDQFCDVLLMHVKKRNRDEIHSLKNKVTCETEIMVIQMHPRFRCGSSRSPPSQDSEDILQWNVKGSHEGYLLSSGQSSA